MHRFRLLLLYLPIVLFTLLQPATYPEPAAGAHLVVFSPQGGGQQLTVQAIGWAKETIRVQGYGFTAEPISRALIAAKQRGVDVQLVLDRSNATAPSSKAAECQAAKIDVRIDKKHPIAHAKVMIIDGKYCLLGSYNWTDQAEHNSEVLLCTHNADLAQSLTANWQRHRDHSEPFQPPKGK